MSEHAAKLARYKHLRQVGLQLNNHLMQSLSKDILDEGGKDLGILKGKTLVLDTQDEIAVLADHCIYDVRRKGGNGIERYLAATPPPPDSDEMVLLQAMRAARFSLIRVEGTEPGVGLHVRDLLRDETLFLMDVAFSQSAPVGLVMAARIMAPEGMYQTTGAALPLGVLAGKELNDFKQGIGALLPFKDYHNLSPEQESKLATLLLRNCLKMGAAEHVQYRDPGPQREQSWASAPGPASRRGHVGRNDRCPCGSGKKFKNCCGSHR
jgi:hypothetical protein